MKPSRLLWIVVVLVLQAAHLGAQEPRRDYLSLGWTDDDRDWFYYTTQGSRLLPYRWFLALEQAGNSKLLRDNANIEAMGFLPGSVSARNPDGLPIGFAKDTDEPERAFDLKLAQLMTGVTAGEYKLIRQEDAKVFAATSKLLPVPNSAKRRPEKLKPVPADSYAEREWLGLTCAACHTGSFLVKEREQSDLAELIVDGAPAMADLTRLLEDVVASLYATVNEPDKFRRFADRVIPDGDDGQRDRLKNSVIAFTQGLAGLAGRSRPVSPFGFARLDAFGILLNEIAGTAIEQPDNWRQPNAPVSYPFLWNTPDLDWVQWNGFAHSTLARNTGEVLGVFADLRMSDLTKIKTSANLQNLYELEERVKKLASPAWPEKYLGEINQALAERGGKVYREQKCAECHALPPYPMTAPTAPARSLIEIEMIPLAEIGTDPAMAVSIIARTGKTGSLKPLLNGQEVAPIGQIFSAAVGTVVKSEFDRLAIPPEQRFKMNDRRGSKIPTVEHLAGYKARPLNGIWATAPYLHNGSVPTLYHLLQPPHKRPVVFHVGDREFDVQNVGLKSDAGAFEFNTELPGNRNTGHYYGTNMGDDDRQALIEYLKTL
ncbi:MAG: di-heme-cytochrome C peroxidase [Pirellulales bacterium]